MDRSKRLPKELAVYDLLDTLGICWTSVDHEAAMDMASCAEADRQLGTRMCKNLFLCNRQHSQFYLLMLPGEKIFHTKDLSKQIGSARLSFAEPEYMEQYLNIQPGAVSVMGLMNDHENHVQLLIDQELMEEPWVGCHPCVNTGSLKLSMEDLLQRFLPYIHHDFIVVSL